MKLVKRLMESNKAQDLKVVASKQDVDKEMVKKAINKINKGELVDSLTDFLINGEGYLESKPADIERARKEYKKLLAEYRKLEKENAELKSRLEKAKVAYKKLEARLEKAKEVYRKMKEQMGNLRRAVEVAHRKLIEKESQVDPDNNPDIVAGKLEAYHVKLFIKQNPIDIGKSYIVGSVSFSFDPEGLISPNRGLTIFKDKKTGKVTVEQTRIGVDKQGRPMFALDRSGVRGDHIKKLCDEVARRYSLLVNAKKPWKLTKEETFPKVIDC